MYKITQTKRGTAIEGFKENPQSKLFPFTGIILEHNNRIPMQWKLNGQCGCNMHSDRQPQYDIKIEVVED